MCGDYEQVEKDEDKKETAVCANLVGDGLKANTEMPTKFMLYVFILKARACIDPLIGNEHSPLADHREEKSQDDCAKPGCKEAEIPQQENNLSSAAQRFLLFVTFMVNIKEARSYERNQGRSKKEQSIAFQDQQSHPKEVGVCLPTWSFENEESKCGKAA